MPPTSIASTIRSVISDCPGEIGVRSMARLCHRIALVYLSGKVSSGHLDPGRFGLTLSDLAHDSIADLFQRNSSQQFPAFRRYFCGMDGRLVTDAEYVSALRRLLFSHVNQHLFRLHREFDPSLGKIIRNIKLASKKVRHLHLDEVLGEPWIVDSKDFEDDRQRMLIPPEILERLLAPALSNNGVMTHALEEFRAVLLESPAYRPAYPLVGLSLVLRRIMSHFADAEQETVTNADDGLAASDVRAAVEASVKSVRREMKATYVTTEKVCPEVYEGYFVAIENLLTARYVRDDGLDLGYFELVGQAIGPITREQYMSSHRVRFEYLAKLTRRAFIRRVEREL